MNVSYGLKRSCSARKNAPSGPILLSEISSTFRVRQSGYKDLIEWARAFAPLFLMKFLFRYKCVSLTFLLLNADAISIAPSSPILLSFKHSSLKVLLILKPWQNLVMAISPRQHLLIDNFLRVQLTLKNSKKLVTYSFPSSFSFSISCLPILFSSILSSMMEPLIPIFSKKLWQPGMPNLQSIMYNFCRLTFPCKPMLSFWIPVSPKWLQLMSRIVKFPFQRTLFKLIAVCSLNLMSLRYSSST